MPHAMALVTFSLKKIVGSLFYSLVTDGMNHTAQDTSTRKVRLYTWRIHFLRLPNIWLLEKKRNCEKKLTSHCNASYNFKFQNMLITGLKVFHARNSLNVNDSQVLARRVGDSPRPSHHPRKSLFLKENLDCSYVLLLDIF